MTTENRASTHTDVPVESQPVQVPVHPRPTKEDVIQNVLQDARLSAAEYLRQSRVLFGGE